MNIVEVWLLGVALAMDCFAVSIATAISAKRWIPWTMTRQALMFGLFQGGMTILGFACMLQFRGYIEDYDHWIAFGLLGYLGLKMIYDSFQPAKKQIGRKKEMLLMTTTVILAIATSIDALAVGVSMACMKGITMMQIYSYASIIALCSFVLSLLGHALGLYGARKTNWHMEAIGGGILLVIGIKILLEHTMFS